MQPEERHLSVTGMAHLVVVYIAWGSTYLAIRLAVRDSTGFPPFLLGATRTLAAAAVLLGWSLLSGARIRPTRSEWPILLVSGLIMWIGGNGLVNWAEQRADSGYAALLVGIMPIWVALIEAVVDRRRPSLRLLGAMMIGVAGLLVLTWPVLRRGVRADLWAVAALVFAPMFWGIGSILQLRKKTSLTPTAVAGLLQLAGGLGFAAVSQICREPLALPAPKAWLAWGYLVLVGSILAFTSFLRALRLLPTRIVTTYTYVNPIIAVFLGWLVLRESISGWTIGGTLLVFIGITGIFRVRGLYRAPAGSQRA